MHDRYVKVMVFDILNQIIEHWALHTSGSRYSAKLFHLL